MPRRGVCQMWMPASGRHRRARCVIRSTRLHVKGQSSTVELVGETDRQRRGGLPSELGSARPSDTSHSYVVLYKAYTCSCSDLCSHIKETQREAFAANCTDVSRVARNAGILSLRHGYHRLRRRHKRTPSSILVLLRITLERNQVVAVELLARANEGRDFFLKHREMGMARVASSDTSVVYCVGVSAEPCTGAPVGAPAYTQPASEQ